MRRGVSRQVLERPRRRAGASYSSREPLCRKAITSPWRRRACPPRPVPPPPRRASRYPQRTPRTQACDGHSPAFAPAPAASTGHSRSSSDGGTSLARPTGYVRSAGRSHIAASAAHGASSLSSEASHPPLPRKRDHPSSPSCTASSGPLRTATPRQARRGNVPIARGAGTWLPLPVLCHNPKKPLTTGRNLL